MVEASAADPVTWDTEMEAGRALVPPLIQDLLPSQESAWEVEVQAASSVDTFRGKEAANAEAASTVEQLVPASSEGSSALIRVRPEPRGWDHLCVSWLSRDDLEGEPLFTLEDAAKGGRWGSFEQYRRLVVRSLRTALSIMDDDLPGVA